MPLFFRRLDYCNALYKGIAQASFYLLQLVQDQDLNYIKELLTHQLSAQLVIEGYVNFAVSAPKTLE